MPRLNRQVITSWKTNDYIPPIIQPLPASAVASTRIDIHVIPSPAVAVSDTTGPDTQGGIGAMILETTFVVG